MAGTTDTALAVQRLDEVTAQQEAVDSALSRQGDAETMKRVLNYSPPDLLSPELLARFPKLKAASKNDLTRAFLFSVNDGVQGCCISLLGICQAREALRKCLELNGGGSESAKKLSDIALNIQKALNMFCVKVQDFVVGMAKASSEAGKMKFALKYGATDTAALAEGLRPVAEIMARHDAEFEKATDEQLDEIEKANHWLRVNLEKDSLMVDLKRGLDESRKAFEELQSQYERRAEKYWSDKADLQARHAHAVDHMKSVQERDMLLKRELEAAMRFIAYQRERIKADDRQIDISHAQEHKHGDHVRSSESKMMGEISRMSRAMERARQQQMDAVRDRQRQKTAQVAQLAQREATADPGGVTVRTKKFLWFTTKREVTVRPNRRAAYTRMRNAAEAELNALNAQAAGVMRAQQRDQQQTLQRMSSARGQTERLLDQAQARAQRERAEIGRRQELTYQRIGALEGQVNGLKSIQDGLHAQRRALAGSSASLAEQLKALEQAPKKALELAEGEAQRAFQQRGKKRQEMEAKLRDVYAKFGQGPYTFVAFMKCLRSVHHHACNLVAAFRNMATSLKAAQESFGGEFFYEQLALIPEQHRGDAMLELAEHYQTVAMVAQQVLQEPIRALILKGAEDTSRALDGRQGASAALEAPSGVRIEEMPAEEVTRTSATPPPVAELD